MNIEEKIQNHIQWLDWYFLLHWSRSQLEVKDTLFSLEVCGLVDNDKDKEMRSLMWHVIFHKWFCEISVFCCVSQWFQLFSECPDCNCASFKKGKQQTWIITISWACLPALVWIHLTHICVLARDNRCCFHLDQNSKQCQMSLNKFCNLFL